MKKKNKSVIKNQNNISKERKYLRCTGSDCSNTNCSFTGQLMYYYTGKMYKNEFIWDCLPVKMERHIAQITCECGYQSKLNNFLKEEKLCDEICCSHKSIILGIRINQISGKITRKIPTIKEELHSDIFCYGYECEKHKLV